MYFIPELWDHIKSFLIDPLASNVCQCGCDKRLYTIPRLISNFGIALDDNKKIIRIDKTFRVITRDKKCEKCFAVGSYPYEIIENVLAELVDKKMATCKSKNKYYRNRREGDLYARYMRYVIDYYPEVEHLFVKNWKLYLHFQREERQKKINETINNLK
jgi:hypothetical protein